jgi:hypothetical protein
MVAKQNSLRPRPVIPNPEPEACPKASGEEPAPLQHSGSPKDQQSRFLSARNDKIYRNDNFSMNNNSKKFAPFAAANT